MGGPPRPVRACHAQPDMYITVAVTSADVVLVGGKSKSVLAQVDSIGGNFAGFVKVRQAVRPASNPPTPTHSNRRDSSKPAGRRLGRGTYAGPLRWRQQRLTGRA